MRSPVRIWSAAPENPRNLWISGIFLFRGHWARLRRGHKSAICAFQRRHFRFAGNVRLGGRNDESLLLVENCEERPASASVDAGCSIYGIAAMKGAGEGRKGETSEDPAVGTRERPGAERLRAFFALGLMDCPAGVGWERRRQIRGVEWGSVEGKRLH